MGYISDYVGVGTTVDFSSSPTFNSIVSCFPLDFQVGDEVEITENYYNITGKGSVGIIKSFVNSDNATIRFSKIIQPNGKVFPATCSEYRINTKYLKLVRRVGFEVGDTIKIIKACSGTRVGEYYVLADMPANGANQHGVWAGSCHCGLWKEELKLIKGVKEMGSEDVVREEVAKVFKNTDEAILVSKEISLGDSFIEGLVLAVNTEAVLEEAKRRKAEREKK